MKIYLRNGELLLPAKASEYHCYTRIVEDLEKVFNNHIYISFNVFPTAIEIFGKQIAMPDLFNYLPEQLQEEIANENKEKFISEKSLLFMQKLKKNKRLELSSHLEWYGIIDTVYTIIEADDSVGLLDDDAIKLLHELGELKK